ncbi:two-component system regulatory protein YycI [Ligilactobacillus ceti]|uniref:YycH protein n=1 Tax=Ligilactobacillus ceti DSM 22408 TaxID=1122146 RepID=A0A0R2KIV3_9LACO|nr:two-component system regulatory protein YycI [Ligilactobacillus ceti]KRN89346.1 YycH protein [Ligilactobacillus ceti DSM 22408]
MNFKRIQRIFLIAFIALDIFLTISYLKQNDMVESTTNTSQETSTSAILKSIRNDQINYGQLDKKTGTGFYLASPNDNQLDQDRKNLRYQTINYNNQQITATFATMIPIKDTKEPQKTLDSVMKDKKLIAHGSEYEYTAELSTKTQVVYVQKIYHKPVLSSQGQVRFNIKNGYVDGYTQGYLNQVTSLREEQTTISEERALIWLYQYRKIPSNSTVLWGELGYTKMLVVNGNTIYLPTWNFCIKNADSDTLVYRRVNAFTGAVVEGESNTLNN